MSKTLWITEITRGLIQHLVPITKALNSSRVSPAGIAVHETNSCKHVPCKTVAPKLSIFSLCSKVWHFATLHVRCRCCWTQQGVFWATQPDSGADRVQTCGVLHRQHSSSWVTNTTTGLPHYCKRAVPTKKGTPQFLKGDQKEVLFWAKGKPKGTSTSKSQTSGIRVNLKPPTQNLNVCSSWITNTSAGLLHRCNRAILVKTAQYLWTSGIRVNLTLKFKCGLFFKYL